MKKTFIGLFFLFSCFTTTFIRGQSKFLPGQDGLMDLKAGPFMIAGAAANAGKVATGSKTSPAFAYSPGAIIDFTYTKNVGFDLSVVYDARTVNFHNEDNSNVGVDYTFGYVALRPELRFGGLLIGVGLGMPVSVTTSASSGAVAPKVSTGDMNALFEGRLGGTAELVKTKTGKLNFIAEVSYAFSKNLNDSWFHGADATNNNGPLATGELGLSYLFDLYPITQAPPPAAALNPGQ